MALTDKIRSRGYFGEDNVNFLKQIFSFAFWIDFLIQGLMWWQNESIKVKLSRKQSKIVKKKLIKKSKLVFGADFKLYIFLLHSKSAQE
jgi:hypothetical protein